MFGQNKIRSPKEYLLLPHRSLAVTSIFFTLQGEGPFQGQPCVFVRLTGCHLACPFCDTFFDEGEVLSFDDIFIKIKDTILNYYGVTRLIDTPLSKILIVVTGGEPLLQTNLTSFLRECHENHDFCTQIESTGSIYRDIPAESVLLLSPKKNDKNGAQIPVNKNLLERADYMKFVVSKTDRHYQDIPDFALEWHRYSRNHGKLYVSPMNCYNKLPQKLGSGAKLEDRSEVNERISFWTEGLLDQKKNQENHEHAAYLAMKHGAKLTLQMQLYANLP